MIRQLDPTLFFPRWTIFSSIVARGLFWYRCDDHSFRSSSNPGFRIRLKGSSAAADAGEIALGIRRRPLREVGLSSA
jgi:hypothetical protein